MAWWSPPTPPVLVSRRRSTAGADDEEVHGASGGTRRTPRAAPAVSRGEVREGTCSFRSPADQPAGHSAGHPAGHPGGHPAEQRTSCLGTTPAAPTGAAPAPATAHGRDGTRARRLGAVQVTGKLSAASSPLQVVGGALRLRRQLRLGWEPSLLRLWQSSCAWVLDGGSLVSLTCCPRHCSAQPGAKHRFRRPAKTAWCLRRRTCCGSA